MLQTDYSVLEIRSTDSLRYGNWWESSLEGSSRGHRGGEGLEPPLSSFGLPSLLVFEQTLLVSASLPELSPLHPKSYFRTCVAYFA